VVVEVADTGLGIKREDIKRIYDPFFTTKGIGRGTGLGLSVSYGIVQEHGGAIFVDSTPGVGTTFQVALPAWEDAAAVNR
jgi:signal transduction histidine kinase